MQDFPDRTGEPKMARTKADSADMSAEGERVKARRERLGLDAKRLAAEAGVSRSTLSAIEDGQGFRHSSLAKIERVLDRYEAEAGITEPVDATKDEPARRPPPVIIRLKNDVGEVVMEGTTEDKEWMSAEAQRILDHMRKTAHEED